MLTFMPPYKRNCILSISLHVLDLKCAPSVITSLNYLCAIPERTFQFQLNKRKNIGGGPLHKIKILALVTQVNAFWALLRSNGTLGQTTISFYPLRTYVPLPGILSMISETKLSDYMENYTKAEAFLANRSSPLAQFSCVRSTSPSAAGLRLVP